MSTRAISSALGVARNTVKTDQREVGQFDPPADEPVDAELVEDESPEAMEQAVKASILGTDA